MSLDLLLRQTAKIGASELRLIPGRKLIVVNNDGSEREVQSPEQTNAGIQQLIVPLLTPETRQAISTAGRASWTQRMEELGNVDITAQVVSGALQVICRLNDGAAAGWSPGSPAVTAAPAPVAAAAAPATVEPSAPAPSMTPRQTAAAVAEMEKLFREMFAMKASDLHISVGAPPMVRHDGEMKALPGYPVLNEQDTRRILWPIAPERIREEFERRNDADFAYEIPGVSRFRCNFFRDRRGLGGVFRVIPSKIITAEEMGLSKEILELCFLSKGLVLVTGPTGSGKSTTLCALIDYINRNRTDHIITIEDPIEFVHENKKCLINQRQVGEHTDSFKDALRAALREDPDIVLVGEMRDLETVSIAIETAETGHLVFGTLHTSSAGSTVDRIIDQFPADRQDQIRVMLASSLKGVISQMLCRKIGGGRIPAMEVMFGIPSIANLIREAKIFQIPSIMQTGKKYGMVLMNEALLDLVKKKIVEPQEAYAKAVEKAGLLSMFRGAGVDVSWAPKEAGVEIK
jgi:twitching motility protein PilT